MAEELQEIYTMHTGKVSDKWSIYLCKYNSIFNDYKDKHIRLLEIGIQNGGSLEVWSRFFPNALKIVGSDINQECALLKYDDPRIVVIVGDVNTNETQTDVLKQSPVFDLIIDDGSHRSGDILRSFSRYFPILEDGGMFVIEDLHCSYWQDYEGGLFYPFSSITFFKRIVDIINHEHWGVNKENTAILSGFFRKYQFEISDEILQHVHSVEFINSMCIIKKMVPDLNKLGDRFIAGEIDTVAPGMVRLHSSQALTKTQINNVWTARDTPPDEELTDRLADLAVRDKQIDTLNKAITELQSSLSWRITRPLRTAANKIRSLKIY